jgi:hypothetical protein
MAVHDYAGWRPIVGPKPGGATADGAKLSPDNRTPSRFMGGRGIEIRCIGGRPDRTFCSLVYYHGVASDQMTRWLSRGGSSLVLTGVS